MDQCGGDFIKRKCPVVARHFQGVGVLMYFNIITKMHDYWRFMATNYLYLLDFLDDDIPVIHDPDDPRTNKQREADEHDLDYQNTINSVRPQ